MTQSGALILLGRQAGLLLFLSRKKVREVFSRQRKEHALRESLDLKPSGPDKVGQAAEAPKNRRFRQNLLADR